VQNNFVRSIGTSPSRKCAKKLSNTISMKFGAARGPLPSHVAVCRKIPGISSKPMVVVWVEAESALDWSLSQLQYSDSGPDGPGSPLMLIPSHGTEMRNNEIKNEISHRCRSSFLSVEAPSY
jgi:hypothetical protein